ncbi:hypothetical protein EV426DRAFT_638320 [Tirmania nivea]|nr:hypothetical protein EV426DRAFT_638320 [Tirmania nivea]
MTDTIQGLLEAGAPLTYNPAEAGVVVGDVNTKRRAVLELRGRGVWSEEVAGGVDGARKGKGREGEEDGLVKVVRIKWVTEMLERGEEVDMGEWTVYVGWKVAPPAMKEKEEEDEDEDEDGEGGPVRKKVKREIEDGAGDARATALLKSPGQSILERARLDAQEHGARSSPHPYNIHSHSSYRRHHTLEIRRRSEPPRPPPLLRHISTSEFEQTHTLAQLRTVPDYVSKNLKYSCLRNTPLKSPNLHFISLLQTIKLARTFSLDAIGIRAYSTSIASIAAYPYPLLSSAELSTLPGCDGKTSSLFHEYIHSTPTPVDEEDENRTIRVVQELEASEEFTTLRMFYGIWGVGAHTAREFYFQRGWRSLDDVVEFGWNSLSRVQQIGVKYYEELNKHKIPRAEVERIADIILATARKAGGEKWDGIVCGGYRRGKDQSGDVDIVLSHPEESLFEGNVGGKGGAAVEWVGRIVGELENAGWVTHTLYLGRGGGFGSQRIDPATHRATTAVHDAHDKDTLAKAMLVWQEQEYNPPPLGGNGKNRNLHRRVDIILAPPSCAGTAILGWTGATTFERDLRRFVEKKWEWKFDSGGVWDRRTGERVRGLGDWRGMEGEGLVECERRLLEGLGVGWREPEMRNTG